VPTAKWPRHHPHPPSAHLSPTLRPPFAHHSPSGHVCAPLVLLAANCTAIIVPVVVAAADMAAFCFHLRLRLVWFWPLPSAGSPSPRGPSATHSSTHPPSDACIKVCSGKMPSRNCYECHHHRRQKGGTGPGTGASVHSKKSVYYHKLTEIINNLLDKWSVVTIHGASSWSASKPTHFLDLLRIPEVLWL